ncbi:hypothetical protein ACMA1I_08145 [Pontibacter sp. 13R65]
MRHILRDKVVAAEMPLFSGNQLEPMLDTKPDRSLYHHIAGTAFKTHIV